MLSDEQIKHMVGRFLNWRLPEGFNPDGGISFQRECNTATPWPSKREPVGTNLFDGGQAEAMVRHMLEGLPVSQKEAVPVCKYCTCANSVTSDPCVVCGKPKFITREWFERRAAAEGDLEIGVGSPVPAPAGEPAVKALQAKLDAANHLIDQLHGPLSVAALTARADTALCALEAAVEALKHSKPVMDHYPAARARHDTALADGKAVITELRSALHPSPTPVSAPVGEIGPRWKTPASELSDADLVAEYNDAADKFDDRGEHGGSPGEFWHERMDEITAEQKRRALRSPAVEGE